MKSLSAKNEVVKSQQAFRLGDLLERKERLMGSMADQDVLVFENERLRGEVRRLEKQKRIREEVRYA